MRFRSTALRAAAFLCAFAVAGAASAQERVKVRFGILTTASQAAFYVGTKKGIFAKYGFDVEVQPLATGVHTNQALGQMLVAGSVEAMAGLEPFLTLTEEKMAPARPPFSCASASTCRVAACS